MKINVYLDHNVVLKMTDAEAGAYIKKLVKESDPAKQLIQTVIDHLNKKTGKNYRAAPGNTSFIRARIRDCGGDIAPLIQVIDDRVKAWGDSPKWATYLRPATLFNQSKFEQYLGALGHQQSQSDIIADWATRDEGPTYESE